MSRLTRVDFGQQFFMMRSLSLQGPEQGGAGRVLTSAAQAWEHVFVVWRVEASKQAVHGNHLCVAAPLSSDYLQNPTESRLPGGFLRVRNRTLSEQLIACTTSSRSKRSSDHVATLREAIPVALTSPTWSTRAAKMSNPIATLLAESRTAPPFLCGKE